MLKNDKITFEYVYADECNLYDKIVIGYSKLRRYRKTEKYGLLTTTKYHTGEWEEWKDATNAYPNEIAEIIIETKTIKVNNKEYKSFFEKWGKKNKYITSNLVRFSLHSVAVLLGVFRYLDDISLWSAGNVCNRWRQLLEAEMSQDKWERFIRQRWPLFTPQYRVRCWKTVFTKL